MISVASIMKGEPKDFDYPDKEKETPHAESPARETPKVSQGMRVAYFANYEQYSTFTPHEYDRPGMRFPFYDGDDD